MKIFALDLGDVWVGTAISDALGMFARPYKTVKAHELQELLSAVFESEQIKAIIVGHPTTMRGGKSQQTQKVEATLEKLKEVFPDRDWILWDESYSSQRAQELRPAFSKEEKIKSHSIAAAYILSSYLDSQALIRQQKEYDDDCNDGFDQE